MKTIGKRSVEDRLPQIAILLLIFSFCFFSPSYSQGHPSIKKQMPQDKKEVVITKSTTKEEVDSIIMSMEEVGLILQYKNLGYNNREQITSISLIYKSKSHNSGQYNVSSEKPINDIIISIDQNNVSISSRGEGSRAMSSQSQITDPDFHRQRGKDIPSVEDRRAEMHQNMENRRKYAEKGRKHRSTQMEARRKQILEASYSDMPSELNLEYRVITKNSTNAELINLKKMYAAEGISFSYSDLERDSNGEIVRIYLTINNRHGTVSSTGFGNGKTPIKDIQLGVDSKNVIVKNKN